LRHDVTDLCAVRLSGAIQRNINNALHLATGGISLVRKPSDLRRLAGNVKRKWADNRIFASDDISCILLHLSIAVCQQAEAINQSTQGIVDSP
jgi:hypothetical protein